MDKENKNARKSQLNETTEQSINQKHDKGYKRIFSRNRNFLHFLKKYVHSAELTAGWANTIDENDLTLINTTLIDAEFKKRESDVVYKMKFKDREIIFYVLLELQSSVDYTMPFRLLRYMTLILNYVFENTPKNERKSIDYRLPAIVPVVLYNGADNWTAVKTFKEYLQNYEQFEKHIIDFEYYILDIRRINDETILTNQQILDIVFLLDKKSNEENLNEPLEAAMDYYRHMSDDDKEDMRNWIWYVWLSHITDEKQKDELLKDFERGDIESMNSGLSIRFENEFKKGEKKRNTEIAKKMLAKNKPIDEIIEFTELTKEEIMALCENQKELNKNKS